MCCAVREIVGVIVGESLILPLSNNPSHQLLSDDHNHQLQLPLMPSNDLLPLLPPPFNDSCLPAPPSNYQLLLPLPSNDQLALPSPSNTLLLPPSTSNDQFSLLPPPSNDQLPLLPPPSSNDLLPRPSNAQCNTPPSNYILPLPSNYIMPLPSNHLLPRPSNHLLPPSYDFPNDLAVQRCIKIQQLIPFQ